MKLQFPQTSLVTLVESWESARGNPSQWFTTRWFTPSRTSRVGPVIIRDIYIYNKGYNIYICNLELTAHLLAEENCQIPGFFAKNLHLPRPPNGKVQGPQLALPLAQTWQLRSILLASTIVTLWYFDMVMLSPFRDGQSMFKHHFWF